MIAHIWRLGGNSTGRASRETWSQRPAPIPSGRAMWMKIDEEERTRYRPVAGEDAAERLGEDRQCIEEPASLKRQPLAEGVPRQDKSSPGAHEAGSEQKKPRHPRERVRAPGAVLREHPDGVERHCDHEQIGGVAMEGPHPGAEPRVGGETRD
jgi:hypothetical protein